MNSSLKSGDVQSAPVAESSCRNGWGSGIECLIACGFKEKKEDMSNHDRRSADTLRVPEMWMDVMCMSKWVTKNVRILGSCITSLFLHEPLFIAVTRLRLSY